MAEPSSTSQLPGHEINIATALKVAGYLFIALQCVVVWQGKQMLDTQKELVNQGAKANERIAVMAAKLASSDERFSTIVSDLKQVDINTGKAIEGLNDDTRDLDRRVSKLEVSKE